ncbi:hypothetical protein ALC60_04491 [Trachymyrmex zeteki]|uniref:THAP-type domain-containing protein n=1 Tax=Mycetomoellerius zeteki TaxID=64791 RepID=A0A151X873_9HYME|nr:hypothetical protein ALC60_04491 [Trachymyrmex zeteki]
MPNCAIKYCKNSTKKNLGNVKYFRFPKDKIVSDMWIKACGNPNVSKQSYFKAFL